MWNTWRDFIALSGTHKTSNLAIFFLKIRIAGSSRTSTAFCNRFCKCVTNFCSPGLVWLDQVAYQPSRIVERKIQLSTGEMNSWLFYTVIIWIWNVSTRWIKDISHFVSTVRYNSETVWVMVSEKHCFITQIKNDYLFWYEVKTCKIISSGLAVMACIVETDNRVPFIMTANVSKLGVFKVGYRIRSD